MLMQTACQSGWDKTTTRYPPHGGHEQGGMRTIRDRAGRRRGRESDGAVIMGELAGHDGASRFQLVVIGTGPVGKTSLVNALLGRTVGEVGATMGTTRAGQSHTHVVEGLEGTLLLTDTPGLGEPGPEGSDRELEAIDLATRADLLVFVVDHDLTRADCQTILELSRQGKRLIVALNKKDRFTGEDREAVMAKLRERLAGFVPVEDIVAVAAPRPRSRSVSVRPTGDRDRAGGRTTGPGRPGVPCGSRAGTRRRHPPRRQPFAAGPHARAGRARDDRPAAACAGHCDH